ncbi:MAG: hypothetical protein C0605_17625 [Hyphomicrobiales bacterium]|jgi:hypothetical protein|nr:MAG: hypothetical protein C0605_17625 [Hyphomicrobiales bacterium]
MGGAPDLALSVTTLAALNFIYKYRYLTVAQVAGVAGLKPKSASEMLLKAERQKLLSHFGNTGIRGYGKTPKVYYLTKRGHTVLQEEGAFLGLQIAGFKPVNVNSRWSPQMYHRLATLDVILSLEKACIEMPEYALPATFVEHRREKIDGKWVGETTDFVEGFAGEKIVPDAGFILENKETSKRALFLIEVDRGTERQVTRIPEAVQQSFKHKIQQYDRYLLGGNFKTRYQKWGAFTHFVLLVITAKQGRLESMRKNLSDLSKQCHQYYRFSTQEAVTESFFHSEWSSRSIEDNRQYPLIRRST